MITILADDLSGAAEVGGVCLAHALAAEVQTAPRADRVPALCLDADTRSLTPREAAAHMASAARALAGRPATWFCKVDSVLRGPVVGALAGLLEAARLPRALLVPANPSRGRVIRDGQFFVQDRLLHETEFARDPEHPAHTAEVAALLGRASLPVTVIRPGEALPPAGIVVGEAASAAHLAHWAARVDTLTLPAGAAEFLAAWLAAQGHAAHPGPASLPPMAGEARTLIVSGTTSEAGRAFFQLCEAQGVPVLRMPPDLFAGTGGTRAEGHWEAATRQALAEHLLAVVAIDQPRQAAPHWPVRLRASLAGLVASVLAGGRVGRLYVEGGATARAIIDRLGWRRLRVAGQLAPGVVVLEPVGVGGPLVVLKPGSYHWHFFNDIQGASFVSSTSA